jgi:hypothetical protein
MSEKGYSLILLIVGVVAVILISGVAYLFFRPDSSTTIIQPNNNGTIRSTRVVESEEQIPEIPIDEPKTDKQTVAIELPAKPAIQNTKIDADGGVTYTNETYKFAIQHPKDYVFDEKIRNYYNTSSTEDPNELVYSYTLSNPQLAPTGGLPGDKIVVTVYQPGFVPYILADQNSREVDIKVGGQNTKKRFGKEGKLIIVGPLTHQNNSYVITYELPTPVSDQTFFDAVIESFKFIN